MKTLFKSKAVKSKDKVVNSKSNRINLKPVSVKDIESNRSMAYGYLFQ